MDGHGWFAGDYENGKMTGAGMRLTVSFQADQTVIVLTRGSFKNGVIVGNATRIMVGLSKDGRALYSEWYFGTVCPHATTKHGAGTAVFQVCLWAICCFDYSALMSGRSWRAARSRTSMGPSRTTAPAARA